MASAKDIVGNKDMKEEEENENDENDENVVISTKTKTVLSELGLTTSHPLLLGSASFTRKLILSEMGVPYIKLVRPIDEKALGDRSGQDGSSPHELVLLLAQAKMDHLVMELASGRCDDELPSHHPSATTTDDDNNNNHNNNNNEWILLTGDQVVTCQNRILEKPESIDEAKEFLNLYSVAPPSTVGSCVIHHHPSGIRVSGVDTATIYFRPTIAVTDGIEGNNNNISNNNDGPSSASSSLIDKLIEVGEPVMSCAGGLMIEHHLVQEHVERIDGTVDSVMGLSKGLVLQLLQDLAIKLQEQRQQ